MFYFPVNKEKCQTVFANRILRVTFTCDREDVTGDFRHLHREELHNLYTSTNRSRSNHGRWYRLGMWYPWEREERMHNSGAKI
jgi:hypothetical protein